MALLTCIRIKFFRCHTLKTLKSGQVLIFMFKLFFYILIPGLSRHKTSSPEDLLRLLQYGNGNRTQHPTDANKESSRSHAVFQVYIKQTGMFLGKKLERHSLNLKKCLSNFLITEESNFDERNGQEMFNWSEVHS